MMWDVRHSSDENGRCTEAGTPLVATMRRTHGETETDGSWARRTGRIRSPSGVATAGPPGEYIGFNMPKGQFCKGAGGPRGGPCVDAAAKFEGQISGGSLSNLAGNLVIGSSTFAKTDRHLNIKAPGLAEPSPIGDPAFFSDCVDGFAMPPPWDPAVLSGRQITVIVSVSAGSLKGTGTLAWDLMDELCFWEDDEGPFTDSAVSFCWLNAELVSSKLAGRLNLGGGGVGCPPLP